MGNSPKQYVSTNDQEHSPKTGSFADKSARITLANKYNATNFTHSNGFEKPVVTARVGPLPHKGRLDQDEVNQ
jgi:hypothetical protein